MGELSVLLSRHGCLCRWRMRQAGRHSPRWCLACKRPLTTRLATGVGLSFFLSGRHSVANNAPSPSFCTDTSHSPLPRSAAHSLQRWPARPRPAQLSAARRPHRRCPALSRPPRRRRCAPPPRPRACRLPLLRRPLRPSHPGPTWRPAAPPSRLAGCGAGGRRAGARHVSRPTVPPSAGIAFLAGQDTGRQWRLLETSRNTRARHRSSHGVLPLE
jgi:hypothetical protein